MGALYVDIYIYTVESLAMLVRTSYVYINDWPISLVVHIQLTFEDQAKPKRAI